MASERDLGKFRSEQQHCGALSCYFTDQRVDLAFRTDINAACGVEAQQSIESAGEPTTNHYLLLVAAAQTSQF